MRPRQVWGAGVLVAALGLVGIVVVAADGQPLVAPDASDSLDLGTTWRAVLTVVVGIAFLAGLAVVVFALLSQQRQRKPVWRSRNTWLVWLVALLLGFVGYLVLRPNDAEREERRPPEELAGSGEAEEASSRSAPPPWTLLVLGGVVVGALVGAAVVGRRLRAKEAGPGTRTTGVRAALETSLVELELGSDPRAAIVAAYARLLEAFERCGVERTAAETPLEHLQRGLASVPIRPGPAQELTALFLEARFSTHPLGEAERERALRAFRAARDDLAGHEPVPIGPRAP